MFTIAGAIVEEIVSLEIRSESFSGVLWREIGAETFIREFWRSSTHKFGLDGRRISHFPNDWCLGQFGLNGAENRLPDLTRIWALFQHWRVSLSYGEKTAYASIKALVEICSSLCLEDCTLKPLVVGDGHRGIGEQTGHC
jgi:hypothetical protein